MDQTALARERSSNVTEPKRLPKGARIDRLAHFDDSANNPANPDPTRTLRFGMQTDNEMMCAVLEVLEELPQQGRVGGPAAGRANDRPASE
jgi:hypothetical protein